MNTYRARERELQQQLAWATINDPKASPEDRAEARSRLEGPGRELDRSDYERMSDYELVCLELTEIVYKRAFARRTGAPMPELPPESRPALMTVILTKDELDAVEAHLERLANAAG